MMSLRKTAWPIAASLLLHAALVALVAVGWQQAEPRIVPKTPQYIEAKLVELKPKAKQAVSAKPEQVQKVDLAKQQRERELAEQRAREERQRQAEARRRAEREKQAERERQKAEEARRKAEQQRQAELERQRQQAMEAELEEALKEERGLILEQAYETEAQSYTHAIRQRIEQHWSRPSSARNNMQAVLSIQLVPTGRVVSVSVVKSSGNAAFDRSAEQAVRAVEVFPEAKEMPPEVFERYYRRFNLLFNPQDLRQ